MPQDPLNEREFELVNIIGAALSSNQRDLSRQMNLSLGLTNMLIRRMVAKGYIRIRQLNQRKVQYILTPKGFTEKMQKSVKYTLKTIRSINLLKERITVIVKDLYNQGEKEFYLLGESGLTPLIEMVFKENMPLDCHLKKISDVAQTSVNGGLILVCQEGIEPRMYKNERYLNFIEEIAKHETVTS